jgi:hypothetical protein
MQRGGAQVFRNTVTRVRIDWMHIAIKKLMLVRSITPIV